MRVYIPRQPVLRTTILFSFFLSIINYCIYIAKNTFTTTLLFILFFSLIWINLRACVRKKKINIPHCNNSTAFFSLLPKTADALTAPFNLKRLTQGQTLYYLLYKTADDQEKSVSTITLIQWIHGWSKTRLRTIHCRYKYVYLIPVTGELMPWQ